MMFRIFAITFFSLLFFPVFAEEGIYIPIKKIPIEVRSFIENGTLPISMSRADLNGNGLQDFIFVIERQKHKPSNAKEGQRIFLILLRESAGTFKKVKHNDKIIYCSTCGGMLGDPFQGVEAGLKTFTVFHYGGSAWRWSYRYKFNYSRIDKTWQLVQVVSESFHVFEPEGFEKRVYTPPKHYGKIDIADFDPNNWKDQGAK